MYCNFFQKCAFNNLATETGSIEAASFSKFTEEAEDEVAVFSFLRNLALLF